VVAYAFDDEDDEVDAVIDISDTDGSDASDTDGSWVVQRLPSLRSQSRLMAVQLVGGWRTGAACLHSPQPGCQHCLMCLAVLL